MKTLLKRNWKTLLTFFVVAIFIIPFIIHVCFKIYMPIKFFQAEWSAGDVLAFYGVLVGSIATVYGVYLSIQYARSNYQEDIKNRVLPFIAVTTLHASPVFRFFSNTDETNETNTHRQYEEYKLDEIYFIIRNREIAVQTDLSKDQKVKLMQGGLYWKPNDSGAVELAHDSLITIPLDLENVGNGVANRLRIGLNFAKSKEITWKYTTPMPLKVGDTVYIHVYSEDRIRSRGTYILDLIYEDIYNNKYRQRYEINIGDPNDIRRSWIDLGCKQESI